MQSQDDQWICPSFNSYSQDKSAETAVRVTENLHCIEEDEEDNFEFALILNTEFETTNQEMYSNFPVFNQDHPNYSLSTTSKLVPLRRLFNEEQAELSSASSSSSEEDEMESIPPGSYCVWKPKMSHITCKKSKSTGFGSKRWKLRDLLRRSNSEGKDSFIFLTQKKKEENPEKSNTKALVSRKKSLTTIKATNSSSVSVSASVSPTRRLIYSPANRDIMRGNETPNGGMQKRKSYLPYRQDLVGFFTTVNSLGRNFSSLKMK